MKKINKVIYGTGNLNKVVDFKKIVKAHNKSFNILSLKDIGFDEQIDENGTTFEENSEIKARAVKAFCDKNKIDYDIIIADDAGLCVDCLEGRPGVFSARYAGDHAPQEKVLKKLLEDIEKTNDEERKARFVCVLTSFLKDGTKIVSKGECLGKVAKNIGTLGRLTYSPVFIPNGYDVPMSNLKAEEYEKAHNHRDKAFNDLINKLDNL